MMVNGTWNQRSSATISVNTTGSGQSPSSSLRFIGSKLMPPPASMCTGVSLVGGGTWNQNGSVSIRGSGANGKPGTPR